MPLIHENLTSLFSDTANAIREKQGSSNALAADNFPSEIRNISVGPNTQDATATANDIISSKTAYVSGGKVTGTIPVLNESNLIVDGAKVTATSGYYPSSVNTSVQTGSVAASIATHTLTNPSVSVSHSGNIAIIGSTTKPAGTAGTDYYQIGFSNSVVGGNINAQAYGNISTNGYVTGANNTVSSWSNKSVSASVTQPATYYVNKGLLTDSDISGASYLENTGDYGFRATVVVPEGYHAGETVTKNFTTGIFPAPESKATADKMLTGYSLYDEDGKLITGSMPNQGAQNSTISTQGGTYTIPAGYHNGSGVVTASIGAASINTPSGSKAQSVPSFVWDKTNRTITASVEATSGTAYANVTGSGYIAAGAKSGVFSMGASSNTYQIDSAAINAPSGSATQSTPSFSWDATNRKITASVAATSGTAYANVESSGFVDAGTKSGTFSMGASSNTYTMAAATINAPSGSATQSTPGIEFNTISGVVTATVNATTGTAYANVTGAGYTGTGTKSGSFSLGASSNTYNIGIGSATTPATTVYTSVPTVSVTNSNGYVAVTSATGTKSVTPTVTAGYIGSGTSGVITAAVNATGLQLNTKAGGTTTVTSSETTLINAGQFAVGDIKAKAASGALGKFAASTSLASDGLVSNISNGAVTSTDKIALVTGANGKYRLTSSGSGGAIVTTAGYLAKDTANSNSTTNAYYVNKATTSSTQPTASATGGTASASTAFTNILTTTTATDYKIEAAASATGGSASTTAGSVTVSEGYAPSATTASVVAKSASGNIATNTATKYLNKQTITAYAGTSKAQSTPSFTFNASNGVVTASVAATSQTIYRNVSEGYRNAADSTAGTFSMTASSNTYNVGLASINAPAGSAKQSKPGLSFNASNGVVTATVAATSGTAYANVTGAGYIAAGAKSGTFTMSAADSNTISVGIASINTPSGSKAQSTPTFSINTSTGVVTASVAATSGTAYANVATAGYTAAGAKSGTFSMTASSNTYTIAAATANTQTGAATVSASSALANAIVNTNIKLTDTATDFKLVSSANATSGAITAKTVEATAGPGYVASGTVKASATVSAVAAKTASDSKTKYVNKATLTGEANSVTVSGKTVTYNIKAVASEGYNLGQTVWVNGTKSVADGAINNPSGSKQQSTPTITLYANGLISATSAATTGTAYRNVTTAGYLPTSTTGGTFSLTASAAGTKQLTTKAGGTTTITGNTKIVDNQTFTTGDVYATVDTGAIRYAQASFSGPKVGMSVANATGIVTASSATSNSLFNYANIYKAGYLTAGNRSITGSFTSTGNTLQLNTKAGGTTNISGNTKIISAGQFAIGDIYAQPSGGFTNYKFTNYTSWGYSDRATSITFPGFSSIPTTFYLSFADSTSPTVWEKYFKIGTSQSVPYMNNILYLNGSTYSTYTIYNVSWAGPWVVSLNGGYSSGTKVSSVVTLSLSGTTLTVTLNDVPWVNGYGLTTPSWSCFAKADWCIWY